MQGRRVGVGGSSTDQSIQATHPRVRVRATLPPSCPLGARPRATRGMTRVRGGATLKGGATLLHARPLGVGAELGDRRDGQRREGPPATHLVRVRGRGRGRGRARVGVGVGVGVRVVVRARIRVGVRARIRVRVRAGVARGTFCGVD